MGYAVVDNLVWPAQWRPSLVVVVGNGPVFVPNIQPQYKRPPQFFTEPDVLIVRKSWQVQPFGSVMSPTDVSRAQSKKEFAEPETFAQSWHGSPRTTTDFTSLGADILAGNDTYGWPEPEVSWSPGQRASLVVLQHFVPYVPANDVWLLRRQRTEFAEPEVFFSGQRPLPRSILDTYLGSFDVVFLRRPPAFFPAEESYWRFEQRPTGNPLKFFFVYNPAVDVTRLRAQTKWFGEPEVFFRGQAITINALIFPPTPPPYNPATDVVWMRQQAKVFLEDPGFGQTPETTTSAGSGSPHFGSGGGGSPKPPPIIIIVNPQPPPPPPPPPPSFLVPELSSGSRVVLSPKRVGESVLVPMDFISKLAASESIQTAVGSIRVYDGIDPNPAAMLISACLIKGTVVEQEIAAGVVGTIYELMFTVTTSASQTLQLAGYFVVEPDLP